MKRIFSFTFFSTLLLPLCLSLLTGCQQQTGISPVKQEASPAVAEVGSSVLYEADVDYEILSMPSSMRHIMQESAARAKVLDVMIKREVVAQKAREMGLNLDPLIAYRMRQAENAVLIQSIREWQSSEMVKPTAKEIKVYYKKHRSDFIVPEQVHARHILVLDKQRALDILKQLKAEPESFPALAAQYSLDDGNKGRGGDLNWFSRGTMVKAFEKAVFALNEKHRFSKPVKTDFGWHVIEWLGKRENRSPTLEDVSGEIEGILEKQRLNNWIKSLMDQADVEVLKSEYLM